MAQSASQILDQRPMSAGQVVAIIVCFFLLALDGFDVLVVAFAAPGIATEWGLSEGTLGWVVTMELIGMAVGSIFMGRIADAIGRRPVMLISVSVMTAGMFVAALSPNVYILSVVRIFTGIGIGAVLASSNAIVAELSNAKLRSAFIIFMTAGYPTGAVIGGIISTELLKVYDWRSLFYFGAICTAVAIPAVYFALNESLSYLETKQPKNALRRINATLARFGHETIAALPALNPSAAKHGFLLLFSSNLFPATFLLSLAYLANISTFYFILKWIPKLVVNMGFTDVQGGYVLVLANVGGLTGVFVLSVFSRFVDIKSLVIALFISGAVMVSLFGQAAPVFWVLAATAAGAAFFIQAGTAGVYPLMARYFPTAVRASGTGMVLGLGRGGAVAGPVLAGYLLQAELPLSQVTMIISIGSIIAAASVFLLGRRQTVEIE